MELAEAQKKIERKKNLEIWLKGISDLAPASMTLMTGDASFRRYFRVISPRGTFVAMDAPPPEEHCAPFVAIASALREMGLCVPDVLAEDREQGFLLLTDFGDTTLLQALSKQNAPMLYGAALDALAALQGCDAVLGHFTPAFDPAWMWQEWAWHQFWFLEQLLGLSLTAHEAALENCFGQLIASAVSQPQVFMHRDYHAANLMWLKDSEEGVNNAQAVGILDFQDAFRGPVTYDLVSLLRDCYIDWPDECVNEWALGYWRRLSELGVLTQVDESRFLRWFDWMGVERHLKALFTFARKSVRDQQPHYLRHVPRTLNYILRVSQRYPELAALHTYYESVVQPAFLQRGLSCEP